VLPDVISGAAERFGDRPVLVDARGAVLSYGELHRRSDSLAAQWAADGLGPGAVVALCVGSGSDYLVAYAAAAKLGAITAGVNPSLAAPERAALLAHLGPDLVVDEPLAELPPGSPPPLVDDDERIVAIVYTSGTTGPPKGAVFRNRQLRAVCDIDLGPGWEDRWDGGGPMLASTQFAHVGFMTKLPWYLRLGITLHVLDRWRAADVLRTVAAHHITTLGVVAPQLALMLRDPAIDELDVSCVRQIIAGGAASPPSLVRAARERFGAAYSIRYSSTESGGVGLATADDAPDAEALHTVGRPRDRVAVRVVGHDGSDVPTGTVGELWLRTDAMFDGYWRDPATTAATLVDGWIRTGDLASVDGTGLVTLSGRAKEMYIRGGYNVAPAEVEAVLADHPAVAAVAVAPRTDEVMGEIGVAVVVPAAATNPPTLDELRAFGAEHLARWKLPEDLVVVDEIPLTPMQKVDRAALAATVRRPDPMGKVAPAEGVSDER